MNEKSPTLRLSEVAPVPPYRNDRGMLVIGSDDYDALYGLALEFARSLEARGPYSLLNKILGQQ